MVAVSGINGALCGQAGEGLQRAAQRVKVSAVQVGAPVAVEKERVAGEDGILDQKGGGALAMSGRVHHGQRQLAKGQPVSV